MLLSLLLENIIIIQYQFRIVRNSICLCFLNHIAGKTETIYAKILDFCTWLFLTGSTSQTTFIFISLLELCPLEFYWFVFWSSVFKYIKYSSTTRIVTHGYEWNLEQLKIFISAYDADKAWVKELIIEKKIDWLWMCIAVYRWMVKAFHK